jgi:hydrogenase maturation protease
MVLGVNPEACEFAEPIRPSIVRSSSHAAAMIARILAERGVDCAVRHPRGIPDLWWLRMAQVEQDRSAHSAAA